MPPAAIRGDGSPSRGRGGAHEQGGNAEVGGALRRFGAGDEGDAELARRDAADVALGERKIGEIAVDDEDGDRSFSFEMPIPVGRARCRTICASCSTTKLTIDARMKKTDSVELSNGADFLGVISADDPAGDSYTLQMAILDFDLEDL